MDSVITKDVQKILLYCKYFNIRIDKRLFSVDGTIFYYNSKWISNWYKFFDIIYTWDNSKEGAFYWYNHQLQLVYFALHFNVEENTRSELIYYIKNLMGRYYYSNNKLNEQFHVAKKDFLQKCVVNNLINERELYFFHRELNICYRCQLHLP